MYIMYVKSYSVILMHMSSFYNFMFLKPLRITGASFYLTSVVITSIRSWGIFHWNILTLDTLPRHLIWSFL